MSQQKTSYSEETCNITWEPGIADCISHRLRQNKQQTNFSDKRPYLVALVGIPGSGKSTSANILSELLNSKENVPNVIIPMDGYHHSILELLKFPNSKDVIYRRGAPDTFDAKSMHTDLQKIVSNTDEEVVFIPGFDHAKGDPEPNKYIFKRTKHDVVICEGLYLLLDHDDWWRKIKDIFDFIIFINADIEECMSRLKERNKCIPGYTPEEIEVRVDNVDRKNALVVQKCQAYADIIVQSSV